jgi:hypothetical protein
MLPPMPRPRVEPHKPDIEVIDDLHRKISGLLESLDVWRQRLGPDWSAKTHRQIASHHHALVVQHMRIAEELDGRQARDPFDTETEEERDAEIRRLLIRAGVRLPDPFDPPPPRRRAPRPKRKRG